MTRSYVAKRGVYYQFPNETLRLTLSLVQFMACTTLWKDKQLSLLINVCMPSFLSYASLCNHHESIVSSHSAFHFHTSQSQCDQER